MDKNKQYRDKILLGLPMVQASTTEKCAPPFGVFVHESEREEAERKQNQCEQSVRTSSSDGKPSRMSYIWWKWEDSKNDTTWCKLRKELECYYKWWTSGGGGGCDHDRIKEHRTLARQYFGTEASLAEDPGALQADVSAIKECLARIEGSIAGRFREEVAGQS